MTKSKTEMLVEEIHETFNTAGDKLLANAMLILNDQIPKAEKAERLKRVGFLNANEVKKWEQVVMTKELADRIRYYQQAYPLNKFITEEQVAMICKKYKLVCAPIERYKGFVPEIKLKQVEQFRIKKQDENIPMIRITSAWNVGSGLRSVHANNIHRKLGMKLIPANSSELYWQGSNLFSTRGQESYIEKYDLFENTKMQICAPKKDMDLKGLEKIGAIFQSFTSVTVPDPVVLKPCNGGYLIVAAWGDEASDEIVVNPIHN